MIIILGLKCVLLVPILHCCRLDGTIVLWLLLFGDSNHNYYSQCQRLWNQEGEYINSAIIKTKLPPFF